MIEPNSNFWCLPQQGAIAQHPYPGYFGNSAGPTAYFLAFGSGKPDSPSVAGACRLQSC